MKIRVIYENRFQYLELDTVAVDQLWVSLSLGSSVGLSDEEKRKQLQSAFDAQFNRPDYNNWHQLDRPLTWQIQSHVRGRRGRMGCF